MEISARTKVCAVIGNPVEHSLSPAMHNAAFGALGLDYVYVAFRVEKTAAAVAGFRAMGNFRGLSVTIPHKVAIMAHLDEIDEAARHIGSVNTVVNDGGVLKGSSSDGPGALKALTDAGVEVAGRRVLVLGSGGSARAITFTLALLERPPELEVLGVVPDELETLVRDLKGKTRAGVTGRPLEHGTLKAGMAAAEVVIHCTPVGMDPKVGETLIPRELLRPGQAVFDIVYTPLETRLLKEAKAAGCRTIPGLEMFVNQAVVQFELWTGRNAPVDVMRRVVERSLSS